MAARKPSTTRKSQTKASEPQAATTQPNVDDSAQAPEAGGGEATDSQDAAKEAPKDTGAEAKDAKPTAKDAKDDRAPGEIPAVFVRTRKRYGSRRRAGFRFTREGHGIALSALSDEQLEQLHADPALEVEECTFPAEDDGETER